jgi:hypothetical protein
MINIICSQLETMEEDDIQVNPPTVPRRRPQLMDWPIALPAKLHNQIKPQQQIPNHSLYFAKAET